jgi:hypothetical protein
VSSYVDAAGVHRCVVCCERLLYDPETRDVCAGCRKLRGDPPELPWPVEYRPMQGERCECGAVLDPGTTRHPDCATKAERDARKGQERERL